MNGIREIDQGSGTEPAYLIINADDYGYFDHVSRGILECARQGTVTATGVFANSPYLAEHAAWLVEQPDLDVGVHLNLTDRQPLTRPLANALGNWSGRFPGKFQIAKAIMTRRIPLDVIKNEWRVQIEHCLASNLKLSFLNSHEHIHMLPPLYPLTLALAREYCIDHVRFATPEWPRIWSANACLRDGIMSVLSMISRARKPNTTPIFLGMGESGRLSPGYLLQLMSRLKPGRIYELMCHPGIAVKEDVLHKQLLAYHDWDLEHRTLTDPALGKLFFANNIRLIGYRHLQNAGECTRARTEEISP